MESNATLTKLGGDIVLHVKDWPIIPGDKPGMLRLKDPNYRPVGEFKSLEHEGYTYTKGAGLLIVKRVKIAGYDTMLAIEAEWEKLRSYWDSSRSKTSDWIQGVCINLEIYRGFSQFEEIIALHDETALKRVEKAVRRVKPDGKTPLDTKEVANNLRKYVTQLERKI